MFTQIQPYLPSSPFQSGCFIIGSQQQSLPSNQSLPLRKATYHIDIINGLSEVTLIQQYENTTEKFLEIVYKFPFSPSVCIHRFTASFSKKRIEGIVKQKEQAKKYYNEAVNEGKKAAYGEINTASQDMMTLMIGNIDPKQKVTIQIVYIQELSLCLNTFYKFTLPISSNPKYMNKISKNQLTQSFRKKSSIQEGQFEWDFKMTLKSSRKILAFQSTSHQMITDYANDTSTSIVLTLAKGETLDRDFVLIYSTQEFQIPSYTLGRTDKGSTVMVSFIPKFCSLNLQDAKKEALKADNFETNMDSAKGEYFFLLDRSGSMGGTPIRKAKQALILFLKSLPIDSYFNVGSFGSSYEFLYDYSKKCSTQTISDAIDKVSQMQADMGGTQIEEPLIKIFRSEIIQGYPKLIYFLTDGQVYNTESIIELVRKNVKFSRVNAIGIGDAASKQLIKGCAKKGKGHYTFIYNDQNPSQKIIQLLNDSLSAVISKVQLKYDKDLIQSIVPNAASMPYVLKGEVINFYLTFKGQLQKETSVSLAYEDSQNNLPFKSQVKINPQSQNYPFVDIMGHYKCIKALEQAQSDQIDSLYCAKEFKGKPKIIELSQKYNILSKYTSFLCVEKDIIDGKYQQVKSKGQITIQINKSQKPTHQDMYSPPLASFYQPNVTYGVSAPPLPPPPPIPSPSLLPSLPPLPPIIPPKPVNMPPPLSSNNKSSILSSILAPPLSKCKISIPSAPQPNLASISPSLTSVYQPKIAHDFSALPLPPPMLSPSLPPPPPILSPSLVPSLPPLPPSFIFSLAQLPPSPSQINYSQILAPPSELCQDPFCSTPAATQVCSITNGNVFNQQFQAFIFDPQQMNEAIVDLSQIGFGDQKIIQENSTKVQDKRKNEVKNIQMKKYNIADIVKYQQFEGYWSNLHIIQNLYGHQIARQFQNRDDLRQLITFFILKWMQKHHNQKEYQLIIKKAANWLKKHMSKDYSEQFKAFLI